MKLDTMSFEKSGRVGRLVFRRPEVLNAFNNQAVEDLHTVTDALMEHCDLRVVLVTGEGRSFSTGIDLKQKAAGGIAADFHVRWEAALRRWELSELIFIAGINGWCLGGGLQLALACDLRLAVSTARFGLPAARESLIPGLATFRLPRHIGLGRAKRLILLGEEVDAGEALRIGLVDFVAAPSEFEARLNALAERCLGTASKGMRLSKLLANEAFDLDYEVFLPRYHEQQAMAEASPDYTEANAAYREGRDPVWE
jgi:enoyl-CoA hydratase/carnithine racemase